MKMITLLIFMLAIAFCLTIVNAEQTQQYNKIFLNPFYVSSMNNNQNYSFNVTITPPDKISSVLSAIISFDIYISPSVTFYLWVNNQPCNNPTYTISTTYAGAGQSRVSFDCSNVINKAGKYEVILKPTQANTGTANGWIDLTYSNTPKASLKVFGTEYTYGQTGKVWLQLLNESRNAISDGVCYVDIYKPDGSELIERATMTNMQHDGLYYYDIPIQESYGEGVFPAIVLCYYEATQTYNYATAYNIYYGSYDSGALTDTYIVDGNFIRFKETAINPTRNISIGLNFSASSCINISEDLLEGISIEVYGKFDSVIGDDITLSIYNYTSASWQILPNPLLEGNVWRDVTNSISLTNITKQGFVSGINGVQIKLTDVGNLTDGATSNLDIDMVRLSCDILSSPTWEEVRGAGEIHVTDFASRVWEHDIRNLSSEGDYQVATAVWNYNETINPNLLSQISQSIWNYFNSTMNFITLISDSVWTRTDRNLTYYPTSAEINYTLIIQGVWNYTNRTLTYYEVNNITADEISNAVWNYVSRNLTSEYINNISAQDIWEYVNRTLTFYPAENNLSAQEIWEYTNRSLTFYEVNNITPQDVWEYVNRTLTYYPTTEINYTLISDSVWQNINRTLTAFEFDVVNETEVSNAVWTAINRSLTEYPLQTDMTNYTLIANMVWNYISRNLTYYETSSFNLTAQEIWNYAERNLTTEYINNLSAQEIWEYVNRTLTYYPTSAEINYTLISDMVWTNLNRTLTGFEFDVVNETAVSNAVWEAINRTLTEYPMQIDMTNYSLIANVVWNYISRNLTYYEVTNVNLSAQEIWNYADRNLTYYELSNLSAQEIWEYLNRTLTSFDFDVVNESEIAQYVWQYSDRNLTYYQVFNITADEIWSYINRTLTDNIAQQVWTYQDRNLTYYEVTNVTLTPQTIWEYTNRSLTQDIPYEVWVYANRNLTYYEVSNLSASDVWNYPTRELTYYPIVNLSISNMSASLIAQEVWNYNGTISSNILTQFSDKVSCIISNLLNINSEEWGVDITKC